MLCKKCNKTFSKSMTIDGKKKNLQHRKYCLDCSPFNKHNTKSLENQPKIKKCELCNRAMVRKNERGKYCWSCTNRKNRTEKIKKIQQLTGVACWICDYDVCWNALDFHHVTPENKLFGITIREIQFSWEKIYNELIKCVLLCCRCHREVHAGLIADKIIRQLWFDKWNEIYKIGNVAQWLEQGT